MSLRQGALLKALLVVAFLALNAFYFRIIFGSLANIVWCCDANSYVQQSELIAKSGLTALFEWAGYRSYFNYAVVSVLRGVGALAGFGEETTRASPQNSDVSYSVGAFIFFVGLCIGVIIRFAKKRRFWHVFIPLCCNPILFAFIPYPLQEGHVVVLLMPIATWALLSYFNGFSYTTALSTGLVVGVGWMIKSSYIIAVIPVVIFLIIFIIRHGEGWKKLILLILISSASFALPVLPQVASSLKYFDSFEPYPNNSLLAKQLAWGWEMWRYDTYFDPATARFRGLPVPTPFGSFDAPEFRDATAQRPATAIALAVGHVFGAFNYANPKVYTTNYAVPPFSLINLLVGIIIFLGLSGSVLAWSSNFRRLDNLFIDGLMIGNAAVLPFVAVETRFSLMSLAFLTLRAGEVVSMRLSGREWTLLILGGALFSVAFVLIGTLMFQISAIPMDLK